MNHQWKRSAFERFDVRFGQNPSKCHLADLIVSIIFSKNTSLFQLPAWKE